MKIKKPKQQPLPKPCDKDKHDWKDVPSSTMLIIKQCRKCGKTKYDT